MKYLKILILCFFLLLPFSCGSEDDSSYGEGDCWATCWLIGCDDYLFSPTSLDCDCLCESDF